MQKIGDGHREGDLPHGSPIDPQLGKQQMVVRLSSKHIGQNFT